MARHVRIEFPGAVYHVLARRDRREEIVTCEKDRKLFIETLADAREDLKDLKGSHPVKVAMAMALKQQTTLGNS